MPEAWTFVRRKCLAAVAIGVGLSAAGPPVDASPDWELVNLRGQLSALSAALKNEEALRRKSVVEIVSGLDIEEIEDIATPLQRPRGEVEEMEVSWIDKRHALAALTQVYGGENTIEVMSAGRAGDNEALRIRSGTVTVQSLRDLLSARHLGHDVASGDPILRIPLILERGSTLNLSEGERLLLGTDDGAFIVSFGHIQVVGGEISATHRTDDDARAFAPFIASVGSGTVHLSGATFRRLGFGFTVKFAGFSVLAHPTMVPDGRTVIENTRFDDLATVALVGLAKPEVRGNRFFDMHRNPLLVSSSAEAHIEANLFAGDTPTNAIRVANGSSNSHIERNIVLEGARAGLLVSSGSDNVSVANNVIWRRNGGGVKLFNVRCGRVENNLILDDKQKGVEIRGSEDAFVRNNRIIGNANAGVWVSANPDSNRTYVVGNLLRENGAGFSAASGGQLALKDNDLTNQFPRFLDGDITHQFRAIVRDLNGDDPILLDSGGVRPATQLAPVACEM